MKRWILSLTLTLSFGCAEAPQACEAFFAGPVGENGCRVSVGECTDLAVATAVCTDRQCECFKLDYPDIVLDEEVSDASFPQRDTCALSSDEPADHRSIEELFESECGYRLVKGGGA